MILPELAYQTLARQPYVQFDKRHLSLKGCTFYIANTIKSCLNNMAKVIEAFSQVNSSVQKSLHKVQENHGRIL